MFGQIVAGKTGTTPSGSRCFRYEVSGLRQSEETDKTGYPIRSSGNVFITVPYKRMNEEMQRITRMGGKIVSIQPMNSGAESEG
jgi:sulfite reductase alpha subunit-like flavoprotein